MNIHTRLSEAKYSKIKAILESECRQKLKPYGYPVLITIAGSYQQELATDESDLDIKCIFIKKLDYYFSLNQNVKNFDFQIEAPRKYKHERRM